MATNKKELNSLFIEKYFNYLTFLKSHMENDSVFTSFITKNKALKKVNPKIFIKTWYKYICVPYYTYIIKMDENYFMNNDDTTNYNEMDYITKECKKIYITLCDDEKKKLWEHIINLSNYACLYFQ
tara:strand:- start:26031 stop:26408 length:378 start_codon:yes stop_codon:yes gene_type:complete